MHLVRKEMVENDSIIEEKLLNIYMKHKNIKVGYVRHTYNGIKYKLLDGIKINLLKK